LEDISQQIYSLPPLATWVPARDTSSFSINQIQHTEDAFTDQPLNKDKQAYPCTAFFLNPQKIDSLKCSDRLGYEMLDSIDELSSCQEGNSAPVLF
jgi:hypothetical protein